MQQSTNLNGPSPHPVQGNTSPIPPPPLSAHSLPAPARILLVEDHPLVREGLRSLLSREPHLSIIGECASSREAISAVRALSPTLVLVDISLPGGLDGIELIKWIKSEAPSTLILVLSIHDEALYALRALAAGARGYVMKERPLSELRDAIHIVQRGDIALSAPITQRLAQKAAGASRAHADLRTQQALSDRELEVLSCIGEGQSTIAIAQRLCISIKTVETHRANLRRKLALKGGPELLRYAVAWRFSETHQHPPPPPSP